MENNIEEYIETFMKNIYTSNKYKRRIREDITQRIEMSMNEDPFYNIALELGDPKELATDFMDNLENDDGVPYVTVGLSTRNKPYQYISKKTVFGLPLLHVNIGGRYTTKQAKGIFAIGDVAVGVVAIGGVSFGLVSIGGIAIGAASLGGVAIGGLALGGVAVGLLAFGGVAVGLLKVFGAVAHLL